MRPSAASNRSLPDPTFLSDVFHELSQPLTALHCILELSLQRDGSAEDLRTSIEKALENAERLRQRLVLMRAIDYLDEPSFADSAANLNGVLRELHESMLSLFASEGQSLRIEFAPRDVVVRSDSNRLAGALFYCLEYLLRHSSPGSAVAITVKLSANQFADLQIESGASLPIAPAGSVRTGTHCFELELARRTFRTAGGDFAIEMNEHLGCTCRGTLPLA